MIEERICIVVKTYPRASKTYGELVCCGGINETGKWRRLYPIPFRRLPEYDQFKKYSWVTARLEKRPEDTRPESYRPDLQSLVVEGSPVDSRDGWKKRMDLVYGAGVYTLEEIEPARSERRNTMSTVRARKVMDLVISESDPEDEKKWREAQSQPTLPGIDQEVLRALKPLPYKFQYRFTCDGPDCPGHRIMTTDWEVGGLYRRGIKDGKTPRGAAEMVREYFMECILREARSIHFFVGTTAQHGAWIVGGVAYPPKSTIEAIRGRLPL